MLKQLVIVTFEVLCKDKENKKEYYNIHIVSIFSTIIINFKDGKTRDQMIETELVIGVFLGLFDVSNGIVAIGHQW